MFYRSMVEATMKGNPTELLSLGSTISQSWELKEVGNSAILTES